jgi:AbrB family looped-hinge helix DNA binding protein
MSEEVIILRVTEDGRITIPAQHRRAIGLGAGGVAVARVDNGEIRIRPVWSVLAALEGKPRKRSGGSSETVDRLPEGRRDEVPREAC